MATKKTKYDPVNNYPTREEMLETLQKFDDEELGAKIKQYYTLREELTNAGVYV